MPASIVEPVIALSIAVVAGWHLWRLWRRGSHATDLETAGDGHFGLDRAGWTRLAVVFCFGLVHGLGFAAALGIDAGLLVDAAVVAARLQRRHRGRCSSRSSLVVFPLLALLRRRAPLAGLWATGAIAAGVSAMGLVWFVQRVSGSEQCNFRQRNVAFTIAVHRATSRRCETLSPARPFSIRKGKEHR